MENILLKDRVVKFSLDVIDICKLLEQRKQPTIAKQLMRSATSIGACVHESQHAERPDDFIHKMKIACKEAGETNYWFQIAQKLIDIKPELHEELTIIYKMINKSITTARTNKLNPKH
ncbi:MAG: four helix bundle protein [Sphingobacteriales bacterium]